MFLNLSLHADQIIDIIITVQQAGFFIVVDLEGFFFSCGVDGDGLFSKVNSKGGIGAQTENVFQEGITDLNGENTVVQGIVLENVGEKNSTLPPGIRSLPKTRQHARGKNRSQNFFLPPG